MTLPIDRSWDPAPTASSPCCRRELAPRCEPSPSGRSRSSRRDCVGEFYVLGEQPAQEETPRNKGNSRTLLAPPHESPVSSTGTRLSSTGGVPWLWIKRCRDQVADGDRAGCDHVGVHRHAQVAAAAEGLEPGGRRGDAVLGEVDGAAALDALDRPASRTDGRPRSAAPTQPSSSNGSAVSMIRLVRSRRRSASTPSSRAHQSSVAVPTIETEPASKCETPCSGSTRTGSPKRARQLARRGPGRRPASRRPPGGPARVPSAAVVAAYAKTSSRRRNRRESLPAANRPSPSTTA